MANARNQKLGDLLKNKDKYVGYTFRIGNKNGSGFWFIGSLDELTSIIDEEEEKAKESLDSMLEAAGAKFICAVADRPSFDEYLEGIYTSHTIAAEKKGVKDFPPFEEWVKTCGITKTLYADRISRRILNSRTKFFELRRYIKSFKGLVNCKIEEVYESITHAGTKIVIIDFYGDGKWWDESEKENGIDAEDLED